METQKVEIGEFRDNLANYLLESKTPVEITRDGDTVGTYIPTHKQPTEEQWAAFREAAAEVRAWMEAKGVTEEDLINDFEELRARDRKARRA